MQGRPGPVVLVLPEDMLATATSAPVLDRIEPALAAPAPAALARLRERLAAAERPFVIAGGSGWTADACEALERFAERWQLPVGCAFRFQDVFDNRHPNYAGDVGIGINPKLAARIRDADLIVAIGPRLGEMTTGGYELLDAAEGAPAARPHPRRRRGARPRLRARPRDQLVDGVRGAGAGDARARRRRSAGRRGPPRRTPTTRPTSCRRRSRRSTWPRSFAASTATFPPTRSSPTAPATSPAGCSRFHRYAGLRHAGRTQLAPTSGAMGYGVPAAVAAALLEPHRTVVNLAGDGDFLMNGQELATAIAHGAGQGAGKLVSIVVDNGSYGTIRMHQEREYPGRVSGSDLGNPDFAALARAYGWWASERVDTTAAFEPALRRRARRRAAGADPPQARCRRDHEPDDAGRDPAQRRSPAQGVTTSSRRSRPPASIATIAASRTFGLA